jgi:hypothetical protein
MSARCAGTPVSWLALERYHLGEMREAERAPIASHLAACPACAACLARIEEDDAVPLKPLTAQTAGRVVPHRRRRGGAILATVGGLALAAAALLGVGRAWRTGGEGESRVKGGDVAFTLVRDDDARIADASGVFRDGDRFKALVTCPPGKDLAFDLVVDDAQGKSFPITPASGFACGNDVPLPGAFRLSGSDAETVCLLWNEGAPPDRSVLGTGRAVAGDHAVCKTLAPAPGP